MDRSKWEKIGEAFTSTAADINWLCFIKTFDAQQRSYRLRWKIGILSLQLCESLHALYILIRGHEKFIFRWNFRFVIEEIWDIWRLNISNDFNVSEHLFELFCMFWLVMRYKNCVLAVYRITCSEAKTEWE